MPLRGSLPVPRAIRNPATRCRAAMIFLHLAPRHESAGQDRPGSVDSLRVAMPRSIVWPAPNHLLRMAFHCSVLEEHCAAYLVAQELRRFNLPSRWISAEIGLPPTSTSASRSKDISATCVVTANSPGARPATSSTTSRCRCLRSSYLNRLIVLALTPNDGLARRYFVPAPPYYKPIALFPGDHVFTNHIQHCITGFCPLKFVTRSRLNSFGAGISMPSTRQQNARCLGSDALINKARARQRFRAQAMRRTWHRRTRAIHRIQTRRKEWRASCTAAGCCAKRAQCPPCTR